MKVRELTPSSWTVILLAAGVVVLNIGMIRGKSSVQTYFDLKKSRKILEKTVAGLKEENQRLNQEIMRLRESPSYARKVLRDKYHLTEENEDIIFFAD